MSTAPAAPVVHTIVTTGYRNGNSCSCGWTGKSSRTHKASVLAKGEVLAS